MRILLALCVLLTLKIHADFEVHEWGSINVVTGDSKVIVGDISDDQSDLPPFVDVWSKQPAIKPIAIEKPILYFYTDKEVTANVQVRFPEGMFTQWWPQVTDYRPTAPGPNQKQPKLNNGLLSWRVTVDPRGLCDKGIPKVLNHPWWDIARDVDAATVRSISGGGIEKFLFYRGAGTFKPTMKVDFESEGEFVLQNQPGKNSQEVYTIRVKDGQTPDITYRKSLKDEVSTFKNTDEAAEHLQSRLEAKGLFKKEAVGLVKIWRENMFEKIGQRAMYMMEEADIDSMLPLSIHPKPDKQVRVMLIRYECLTADHKEQIKAWIAQLGHEDYKVRKAALEKIIESGRVAEAVMREAYKKAEDPEVKMSLKEALEKITPQNPNP